MTDQTEAAVFNFDNKQYKFDEVSDRAKHLVLQVQDINSQINPLKVKIEQLDMANAGFLQLLKAELNPEPVQTELDL